MEDKVNDQKRYLGTDALYAYQYLSDEFPPPEKVNFYDICRESRKHINITKRVYSSEDVIKRMKTEKENKRLDEFFQQDVFFHIDRRQRRRAQRNSRRRSRSLRRKGTSCLVILKR